MNCTKGFGKISKHDYELHFEDKVKIDEKHNCPYCDYHLKTFTKTHDWDDRKYHLKCWREIMPIVKSLDLYINCCRDVTTKEFHIQQKREIINRLNELNKKKLRR